jgi:hypothetical protein
MVNSRRDNRRCYSTEKTLARQVFPCFAARHIQRKS